MGGWISVLKYISIKHTVNGGDDQEVAYMGIKK